MFEDPVFQQKLVLLALGAVVSGFSIPYLFRVIDSRKFKEQKVFEAALSRQSRLIEAQATLLDDLTRTLWKWRFLAKGVVYYGARGEVKRFETARMAYEGAVWGLLDEFRTGISRSRRLVSEGAFTDLNLLYKYVVHDLDVSVSDLASDASLDSAACGQLARRFSEEVTPKLDHALYQLALELKLTSTASE
jgi:hypothetical protein